MIGFNFAAGLSAYTLGSSLASEDSATWYILNYIGLGIFTWFIVYLAWWSIGTWRSATNFQNAGRGIFWATAAKLFVVASVVVIIAIWVLLFQKPAPSV